MITRGKAFSGRQYEEEGYSGPVQGLTLAEADRYYNAFFETLGQSRFEPSSTTANLSAWHHRHRWAYELATHPSIESAMKQILGPDLVLWAMHFWYKEPGNPTFIPWHQDIHYWPMEPAINATAWMSLGYSLKENGCLRIIPGTHKAQIPHVVVGDGNSAFGQGLPADAVDESGAVDMEMTPGQIAFFNEATFHGSGANDSHLPRVAFSVRYTTPGVKFNIAEWGGDVSRIKTFLVAGEDRYRLNDAIAGSVPG